jgi:drug/metabolite transporter (DMT)-like permease
MDQRTVIWFIAVGGSVLGVLGAIFGSYCDIKKENTPRSRTFSLIWGFLCWIAALVFVAAPWLASPPYRPLFWLPTALLWLGAIIWNRRQERLQRRSLPPA